ncbi:HNH endonuclease signature motif containing protein [Micromonospora sp. WMMD980]|uniref:HNH endonuclease n=1 Tax=Micromonospora sp. WMMD980 TaxID=3016088 RepID=UPI0024166F4F|nr:HNH endonuclease signature motif containing protein [Micromonospora sp. WMMD980]MDG4801708.1 HNH endonuclease signature motif containing protein [Micromonospora sp. WMMD980]
MAWEGSDRSARLPSDWAVRRLRILRRDAYRCQVPLESGPRCLAPAGEVDHIERGDNHEPENLRAICRWHHGKKTAAEGNAARRPAASRRRPPEQHPGSL